MTTIAPGRVAAAGLVALMTVLGAGCTEGPPPPRAARATASAPAPAPSTAMTTPAPAPSVTPSDLAPVGAPTPEVGASASERSRRIRLRVPAIGLDRLRVVAYRGSADDLPGTRIQDRGVAATPRGRRGGIGPGEVGNMIVTAHRTTHGEPFGLLPSLRPGEHVFVESGGLVYDYLVTRTMRISFRSARSIARQSAPVPGRLGVPATRAMITLSTCATPEDHAVGNYWSDSLGNPEHRIDKVGVLVDVRPA